MSIWCKRQTLDQERVEGMLHQTRRRFRVIWHVVSLAVWVAVALGAALLSGGHIARASGPGYCSVPAERAPTRSALHLNRTEGPAGTNLLLSGSLWPAGAHLIIHADKQDPATGVYHVVIPDFGSATVGSDGSVVSPLLAAPSFVCIDPTGAFADPSLGAEGSTLALVAVADTGAVSAPAMFHYLAAPTVVTSGIDPAFHDVKVGATVGVSGTDWEGDSQIQVTLTDSTLPSPERSYAPPDISPLRQAATESATADGRGTFAVNYPITSTLGWGSYLSLTIQGTGPRFGTLTIEDNIFLLPAVPPTFVLDRTVVTPGSSITISGKHWNPGQTLALEYCRGGAIGINATPQHPWPSCLPNTVQVLGTAAVDATGQFSQTVTLPANARLGTITVQADAPLSERVGWHGVVVSLVSQLPPSNSAHTPLPVFLGVGLAVLVVPLVIGLLLYRKRQLPRGTQAFD